MKRSSISPDRTCRRLRAGDLHAAVAVAAALALAAPMLEAAELPDGASIALNFGADEPDGARSDVTGPAGVLGTAAWNNLDLLSGENVAVKADVAGVATETEVTVSWTSNNTWASQGRGEENNTAPAGNDRNLMTGYLDTDATAANSVTVTGLGEATYDVVVYTKGGVIGRGGEYTIGDTTQPHVDAAPFDGSYVLGGEGDYLVFKNVSGAEFTLQGQPATGDTPRAPINAVEVVIGGGVPLGDRQTLDLTKTRYALPLAEPPTIDGILDTTESWSQSAGWAGPDWRVLYDETLEDFFRGGGPGDGPANPPIDALDLSYDIFAGYDQDNLYIAVRVVDDWIETDDAAEGSENGSTWLDDSVEIFIDGDNSNYPDRDTTGTNPEVVATGGQYVITANNAYRQAEAGNPGYGENAAWYARTEWTDNGYEAEFRISLDILGNPEPGDIIGFTVAVNDDDGLGQVERQIIWVGSTHVEASYGNLVIGGKTYVAPKAAAPTVDGSIGADEYAGAEMLVLDRYTGAYHTGISDDIWEEGDHRVTGWITHDDEAVYAAFDVVDDLIVNDSAEAGTEDGNTWMDDSVEILFDPDDSNDTGRGAQNYEGQYVITANGAWRDNEANNPTYGEDADWYGATTRTEGGYQIEFKVKKSALLDPEDGMVMGFNIALNDDDGVNGDPSDRKLQLNWSGYPHSEYTYGYLQLAEAAAGPSNIAISLSGDEVTIAWDGAGTLKQSSTVEGPYTAVEGATSPYTTTADQAEAYYLVE